MKGYMPLACENHHRKRHQSCNGDDNLRTSSAKADNTSFELHVDVQEQRAN